MGEPDATGAVDGLRGLGCGEGIARGRAALVLDPAAAGEVGGKVLVAPMTDPGWVYLMVRARGLVVERGNPLSHTAILGRELGIPTVVGVEEATRRIRDGDELEINGGSGLVRIVECAGEPDG